MATAPLEGLTVWSWWWKGLSEGDFDASSSQCCLNSWGLHPEKLNPSCPISPTPPKVHGPCGSPAFFSVAHECIANRPQGKGARLLERPAVKLSFENRQHVQDASGQPRATDPHTGPMNVPQTATLNNVTLGKCIKQGSQTVNPETGIQPLASKGTGNPNDILTRKLKANPNANAQPNAARRSYKTPRSLKEGVTPKGTANH